MLSATDARRNPKRSTRRIKICLLVGDVPSAAPTMGHLSKSERIDAAKVVSSNGQVSRLMFSESNGKSVNGDNVAPDMNNNEDFNKTERLNLVSANGKAANKSELNEADVKKFIGPKIFGVQYLAPLKWDKIIMIGLIHIVFLYVAVQYSFRKRILGTLWSLTVGGCAGFGVTAGAHRLWTHRAYKAKLPLRIILMLCFAASGQNTLYEWVRDHRVHHKFTETDGDPHNSKRGFFFAHVGWLMMHKHPEVLRLGRQLDMSDVTSDPVVQFHEKYFIPLKMLLCFIFPVLVPVYFFDDSWYWAVMTEAVIRYVFSLNFTWSVNSAAHMWGTRPYDTRIRPTENIAVSIIAMGEGWHNYHHVFPWDYKAAELGVYTFNVTTFWIDQFAKIGWAYDLKQPSKDLIRKTIEKHGDGTHPEFGHHLSEVPMPEGDAPIAAY